MSKTYKDNKRYVKPFSKTKHVKLPKYKRENSFDTNYIEDI